MSVEGHHRDEPSLAGPLFSVRRAARAEAARSDRSAADVEHLLLGLLVDGGPSTRALVRAGADLPRLRAAVADLDRPAPAVAVPPALQPHVAYYDQLDGGPPLSGRAWQLLDRVPDGLGDDRQLLRVLLDDPRATHLLEHAGVDHAELRRTASDHDPSRPTDAGAPATSDDGDDSGDDVPPPWGGRWTEVRYSQVVPVDPARIWALLSSPQRRPEWDPRSGRVEVDPERPERFGTFDQQGRGPTPVAVTRQVPEREIWWERGNRGAEPSGRSWTLQARLEPEGAGSVLHLRTRWPWLGGVLTPLRLLQVVVVRAGLRGMAQRITQAAGSPTPPQAPDGRGERPAS